MATNAKETETSLKGKVAAEKVAEDRNLKTRVASAWTLTKSMLPTAPQAVQVKMAQALLAGCSTRALTTALKQTAVNAHWTRVAEEFAAVHKVDMNDLLENPSVLSKEKAGVQSELKGDAKSAAAKTADDRKDAGPLPAEYPEPKRDEPSELDGSKAGEGRPDNWTEGPGKEAAAKKACDGKDCKGCDKCKKEAAAECGKDCKGCDKCKKEASAKKADGEPGEVAGEKVADEAAAAGAESVAEGAEEVASEEESEEGHEEEHAAEGEEVKPEGAEETFDPEKTNLEEAAHDIEQDVEKLQDAIAELQDEPSDLSFGAEESEGGEEALPEGGEGEPGAEGAGLMPEGEELNLDDIFNPESMEEKVAALNDDEVDLEIKDGEDFFAPSDPSELEQALEQEEELTSPVGMFASAQDPMASILASSVADADSSIVAPGDLMSHFETDTNRGEGRDAMTDHDGDIFDDVLSGIKQPERNDQRDTKPNLKEPAKTARVAEPIRTIRQTPKEASESTASLASLLFTDEDNYR